MARHALAALLFALPLAACAPSGVETSGEDTSDEVSDLSAKSRSYVTMRHDDRKCASPMCGGWWVQDVNRKSPKEVYVSDLDFGPSGLDEASIDAARSAAAGEVVLRGKLGPIDPASGTRTFLVSEAWRGMPGLAVSAGDVFYSIEDLELQCIAAPCDSLEARRLNSTKKTAYTRTDASIGTNLHVAWLVERAERGAAIVAGAFEDGEEVGVGTETVLTASQVFVRLPEQSGPCPLKPIQACPEGQVMAFEYTADRCEVPSHCVEAGACIALAPTCDVGLVPVSWPSAPFGCSAYVCEPEFLFPASP